MVGWGRFGGCLNCDFGDLVIFGIASGGSSESGWWAPYRVRGDVIMGFSGLGCGLDGYVKWYGCAYGWRKGDVSSNSVSFWVAQVGATLVVASVAASDPVRGGSGVARAPTRGAPTFKPPELQRYPLRSGN